MAQTGLLDKITESALDIDNGRKWLDTDGFEREGRISYRKGIALALLAFREAADSASRDLELLTVAEYTFLGQELNLCAPQDTQTASSLKQAMQSFDEAFLALNVVEAGSIYHAVDECLPHRREYRYNDMPKDSFHVACTGHKTRLTNILRSPGINLNEKELLEQRRANMVTAQAVYVKKQKNAFGIE
ncbi:MAG: hypothetical protein LBG27_00605 [Spirochaetaceae bacterium]|nr:hypothetical protein [Spirochaetaceae bacterium]